MNQAKTGQVDAYNSGISFWQHPWFPWIVGSFIFLTACFLVVVILWYLCRHFTDKEQLPTKSVKQNNGGNSVKVPISSSEVRPIRNYPDPSSYKGASISPTSQLPVLANQLSVQTALVQPLPMGLSVDSVPLGDAYNLHRRGFPPPPCSSSTNAYTGARSHAANLPQSTNTSIGLETASSLDESGRGGSASASGGGGGGTGGGHSSVSINLMGEDSRSTTASGSMSASMYETRPHRVNMMANFGLGSEGLNKSLRVSSDNGLGINGLSPSVQVKRKRGLFESRRGSHNSLTLSLSSSADSISSLKQQQERQHQLWQQDVDSLRAASAPLRSLASLEAKLQPANQHSPLYEEFSQLPMNYASKSEVPVPNYRNKTRYQITPNEISRVKLPILNDDLLTTYINANFIKAFHPVDPSSFIATEGPLPNTIYDFWRMVWLHNVRIIVMITNLSEKNKPKCEQYFPDLDPLQIDHFQVSLVNVSHQDGFLVNKLVVKNSGRGERVVHHLWCQAWLDHTTPNTALQLLHMIAACQRMQRDHRPSINQSCSSTSPAAAAAAALPLVVEAGHDEVAYPPVVVHCSAGLGRTGCFIALWQAVEQLRLGSRAAPPLPPSTPIGRMCARASFDNVNDDDDNDNDDEEEEREVDLLAIVARLRLQRGGMVQTHEQYEFLHHALFHFWKHGL